MTVFPAPASRATRDASESRSVGEAGVQLQAGEPEALVPLDQGVDAEPTGSSVSSAYTAKRKGRRPGISFKE
jgi:hypothetical protein